MVMKQHSIRLVGIVVFALCMAANADPNDFVFRVKCNRSRITTMQRETDDWPDLTPSTSSTSPELLRTRIKKPGASHPLRFQDACYLCSRSGPVSSSLGGNSTELLFSSSTRFSR